MSEAQHAPEGQVIEGRYRVVSRIADGGMATVYQAVDERLGRTVAIKIMHTQLAQGPQRDQFVERFHREARSAAAIANPHIVQVYDTGEFDGLDFLVMEYVHGVNLRYEMNQQVTFSVRETLRIVGETLDGLASAHRAGVVHRDIKPENIILTKDSSGKRIAKLGDFGLAKNYLVHGGTLTGANEWIGTIFYCPPEQILDFKHSSPASDLYAMGIAFYNSITGQFPYDFPSREECAQMVRRGKRPRDPISFILGDDKPIPIEKRLPGIDRNIAKVVNAAIEKDVKKRIGVAEFVKAISV